MKNSKQKPCAIPNVVGSASIQVIDEMKWKTLSTVIDAPNPIKAEASRLAKMGHTNLWVRDTVGLRRPLF